MATLMNRLEAGRRLAEKIPYSIVALTLVIQLFVYPEGWPEHVLWFALLLLIVARGPGAFSLDHLIWSRAQPQMAAAPR
jgi:putative oxidoreductase